MAVDSHRSHFITWDAWCKKISHPLHITQQEWLTIIDVINILKPCQVVTDKIQSNTATLLDVYTAFDKIMSESVSNSNGNDIAITIYNNVDWNSNNETSVPNIIKYRYHNYTNTAAIKTIHSMHMWLYYKYN